jgi:integrase
MNALTTIENKQIEKVGLSESELKINNFTSKWLSCKTSGTKKTYEFQIKEIVKHFELNSILDVMKGLKLTSVNIQLYIEKALKSGLSKSTVKSRLSALGSFLGYMTKNWDFPETRCKFADVHDNLKRADKGLLKDNKSIKHKKIKKRFFSERTLNRLIELTENQTLVMLLRWLTNTGMRVSGALSLEYYDEKKAIELGDDYTNYVRFNGKTFFVEVLGKGVDGGRIRDFLISKELSTLLIKYKKIAPGQKLFTTRKGTSLNRHAVFKMFTRLKAKYNKKYKDEKLINFSPHCCRHTYCYTQRKNGVDPAAIAAYVGNSIKMIVECYAVDPPDISANFSFGLAA